MGLLMRATIQADLIYAIDRDRKIGLAFNKFAFKKNLI
jgi:hypothetical protein